jgi:hypothetical protein
MSSSTDDQDGNPVGIRHILVNGAPIQVDGVHDAQARPGRLVRPA